MNYFELYGWPVLMKVDSDELRTTFDELNRRYAAGPSQTEQASAVHKAFEIFQHPESTIEYVLQLKKLIHEDEVYEPDPDFLMQVADINRQLAEPDISANTERLDHCETQIKTLLTNIYTDVASIVEYYQEGITSEKELLQVKEYYYRKKYLQRILDRIYQIRNIASHF